MKTTSSREIHITFTEAEANGIVNALSSVMSILTTDGMYEAADQQGLLLKLKTELVNAPR